MSRNCRCNRGDDYNRHYKKKKSHDYRYDDYKRGRYGKKHTKHAKYGNYDHESKYKSRTTHEAKYATKHRSVTNPPHPVNSARSVPNVPVTSDYKKLSESALRSWDTVHQKARDATTDEKKIEFGKYIEYLIKNFPCPRCRPHIKQYLLYHPLRSYYNMMEKGKDIGMSKWSWQFHNNVSIRLRKPTISWADYTKKYLL